MFCQQTDLTCQHMKETPTPGSGSGRTETRINFTDPSRLAGEKRQGGGILLVTRRWGHKHGLKHPIIGMHFWSQLEARDEATGQ